MGYVGFCIGNPPAKVFRTADRSSPLRFVACRPCGNGITVNVHAVVNVTPWFVDTAKGSCNLNFHAALDQEPGECRNVDLRPPEVFGIVPPRNLDDLHTPPWRGIMNSPSSVRGVPGINPRRGRLKYFAMSTGDNPEFLYRTAARLKRPARISATIAFANFETTVLRARSFS
jgi:hypothetical protein